MENSRLVPILLRSRVVRQAACALLFGATAPAAFAVDSTFTGTGVGASWFVPGNWSTGALPVSTGTASIAEGLDALYTGSTSSILALTMTGNSNLTVTGAGSVLNVTGLWDEEYKTQIRSGTLSVTNGAYLNADGGLELGKDGTSTLIINTSGTYSSGYSFLGVTAGSVGVATVSGTGSHWIAGSGLHVGAVGSGTVSVTNGARLTSAGWNVVGLGAGSVSSVTVSGTGSVWDTTGNFLAIGSGENSVGTVRVENGGFLTTANPNFQEITLGGAATASGSLIQVGGTVSAGSIHIGMGTGTYRLEGGLLIASVFMKDYPTGTYVFELAGGTVRAIRANPLDGQLDTILRQGTTSTLDTFNMAGSWSAVISGGGALAKSGSNTLTLSGSNSYSGGTTFTTGGLLFGHDSALGSGTLAITGNTSFGATGATRTIANDIVIGSGFTGTAVGTSNLVQTGVISGDGSLAKAGTGTLTLSGSNSYAGNTTLTAGTIRVANANAMVNSSTLVFNGGTLSGDGAAYSFANAVSITANSGFSGSSSLTFSGITNLGTTTRTLTVNNGTTTFSGVMAGTAGLTKSGTGTLVLSGTANTFTGKTTISSGTLVVAALSSLGNPSAGANSIIDIGATSTNAALRYVGGAGTTTRIINLAGSTGGATIDSSGSGALTLSGSVSAAAGNKTLTLTGTNGGANTISGRIANGSTGSVGVTKAGSGYWQLTGANTFSGAVAINEGVLAASNIVVASGSSHLGIGTGAVSLGTATTSGTLAYLGNSATYTRGFTIGSGGGGLDVTTAGQTLTIITGITNSGRFTIGGAGNTAINSIISGSGSLEKTGSGLLTLSGSSTYTGQTTISDGMLKASSIVVNGGGSHLGNSTSAVVLGSAVSSGTLSYTGFSATYTRGFTVNAGGGGLEVAISGQTLGIGTGTISTAGRFTVSGSGNAIITSLISGTGSVGKEGSGSLAVTGSNTYSGGTFISGGTLSARNNHALGTGDVRVNGGTLSVEFGTAVSNDIILSGGTYIRTLNGSLVDAVNASSDLGGMDTTARIAAGTLDSTAVLVTSFSATSIAENDAQRLSDVYAFAGTGSDLFVLELSITSPESASYLGWLDGNVWVAAVDGNDGNNATAGMQGYQGSFAAFQLEYGTALEGYIGAYGTSVADGVTTTWAVLNHNSDFAVVPEPGTVVLAFLGLAAMAMRRSRTLYQ
jgi:fibronectin-binding autotransporter adhesin